jgi:DNA-binding GntR family transcriptional regulator
MNAVDRAYDFAKSRILDGQYPGGELISEAHVADKVGISRTPVREAFLRLQSEGLLRLYPKRGALVVPVSVSEIENVMETRLVIERHAIQKVVRERHDLASELHAAMERQRMLARERKTTDFVAADREFHRLFIAATGNEILLSLHDSMRDRQTRMGLTALARSDARVQQILEEHEGIARAVVARDERRAADQIVRHLMGTSVLLGARGDSLRWASDAPSFQPDV